MTGWTWDYVEWNIDLPRLGALNYQWIILPPIAMQIARITSYLGYKPGAIPGQAESNSEIEKLLSSMPSGGPEKIMSPEEFRSRLNHGK